MKNDSLYTVLVIYGACGSIQVHTPWVVEPEDHPTITVSKAGGLSETIVCGAGAAYAAEADALASAIADGGQVDRMNVSDSLANLLVLDQWRDQIGLRYSFEREDASTRP
ncbi:hypothetical protein [Arthrobacter sp. W4I7]|uniref:hypothetical protein n=1 Tax=Arthrobacter sp. W4I7 TaxID=3042296 RepID=UPI00277FF78A|nr:hypothetical protein [Arthrobacter sp. W4I7]MDQ0693144.1 hypothetical protein [Arthrobacter sp. W4I7]